MDAATPIADDYIIGVDPKPTLGWCASQLTVGHETFTCLNKLGNEHPALHSVLFAPPCPDCRGRDLHSETCPTPDTTNNGLNEITWNDVQAFETMPA